MSKSVNKKRFKSYTLVDRTSKNEFILQSMNYHGECFGGFLTKKELQKMKKAITRVLRVNK